MLNLKYCYILILFSFAIFCYLYMSDFNKSISQEQLPIQRLPDVIIMGVKKSGTMTLDRFLNHHPSIKAKGEVHYFGSQDV